MTEGQLIGTKEAGEILGYTPAYMRELCGDKKKKKILGATKVGKTWLFKKKRIEKIKLSNKLNGGKKKTN